MQIHATPHNGDAAGRVEGLSEALPHADWPEITRMLTQPWPNGAAEFDVRWWVAEASQTGQTVPAVRELAERWGWAKSRVHDLLTAPNRWACGVPGLVWPSRSEPVPAPLFGGDFEDPGPLTHADVVARSVRWLRTYHGCEIALAEIVTAHPYYPDAIGWRVRHRGWSVLVEAKVSRSDFAADRKKPIHSSPDNYPGQERWYLTPPGLVSPSEVPPGWGLAECGKRTVRVVAQPDRCVVGPDQLYTELIPGRSRADFGLLLAALRRHQLGVEWFHEVAKFAPMLPGPSAVAK